MAPSLEVRDRPRGHSSPEQNAWPPRGFPLFIGALAVAALIVHAVWLPWRHGINGWTGEPKDKYYALRGWKYPPPDLCPSRSREDHARRTIERHGRFNHHGHTLWSHRRLDSRRL